MDFSIPRLNGERPAESVRDLVEHREVIPLEPALLSKPFSELIQPLNEVRRKVKQGGLWAPHVPKDLGGMGLNCVELALVGEELGRSPLGHYTFDGGATDAGNTEILANSARPRSENAGFFRWLPARSAVASP